MSKWWNSQRQRIIILLLVCLFLGMGLVAVEAFVTLRPSEEAAVAAVIDRTLVGSSAVNASYRVIQTYPLRRAQVVVGYYTQHTAGHVVQQFYVDYVTRHLLTGTGVYSSVGEYMLTGEGIAPLSLVHAQWENATIVGGVVQSPHVKTVEATWADAARSTAELIDGTFLLVREGGVPLAWVVGLDDRGGRVPDSLVYADNLPHWLEYERTRWITTPEGIIVLGAYMLEPDRTCVELRFLTVENARKRVTGEEAFTKQVGCGVLERNRVVGSPVSTIIENNIRTSAGVVEDESVTEVEIRWSDGFVERVPVIDGFYFVQRQGTQAAIYAVIPHFAGTSTE